jgi:hypothetical protein
MTAEPVTDTAESIVDGVDVDLIAAAVQDCPAVDALVPRPPVPRPTVGASLCLGRDTPGGLPRLVMWWSGGE